MAILNTLGVDNLSIRGVSGVYHRLNRFFASLAEANAAITSGDFVPVAGVANAAIVLGHGIMVYDEATQQFAPLDTETRTIIEDKITELIGGSPESLDTLKELADAINENPQYFQTVQTNLDNLTSALTTEVNTRQAESAALQSDIDQNEADADAAYVAADTRIGNAEVTFTEDITNIDTSLGYSASTSSDVGAFTTTELTSNITLKTVLEEVGEGVRRLREGIGVNKGDSDLGTFTGSTIPDASSIKAALQSLETSLEAVDIDTDDMATLVGLAENVQNLGTFTGNTIADAGSIKEALQALETASETETSTREADIAAETARVDALIASGMWLFATQADFPSAMDNHGRVVHSHADGAIFYAHGGMWHKIENEAEAQAARDLIQADVDQNETDADAAIAAVQADVDQNESDADAAVAAENAAMLAAVAVVQADVDQNESDADAAIAAVQTDVNQNEAAALAGRNAIQADVDANEAASIASLALKAPLASPALTGTPTAPTASQSAGTTQVATTAYVDTAVANLIDTAPGALNTLNELAAAVGDDANFSTTITNSIAAVQSDVNQNEVDADAAIAAVQADVDQNETDGDAADAALGVRIDTVETEIDTARTNIYTALGQSEAAQNMGTFTGSTLSDNTTVRALLQELETDTESRLSRLGGILTGDLTLKKSDGSAVALRLSRTDHADMNTEFKIQPSYVSINKECLVVMAGSTPIASFDERARVAINTTDPDYTLDVGGDGKFSTDLIVGGTLTLGSTAITATAAELNYTDGVTSNIQTQLDAKLAAETITMTAFKAVVAASSDFADFKSRVAAL